MKTGFGDECKVENCTKIGVVFLAESKLVCVEHLREHYGDE